LTDTLRGFAHQRHCATIGILSALQRYRTPRRRPDLTTRASGGIPLFATATALRRPPDTKEFDTFAQTNSLSIGRLRRQTMPSPALADVMNNVDKVQDQHAYREGLFVRALGRPLSGNPYPAKSPDGLAWEEGWRLIDRPRISKAPDGVAANRSVPRFPDVAAAHSGHGRLKPSKEGQTLLFFAIQFAICVAVGGLLIAMLLSASR
jgi:hypothetical protein